MVDRAWGGSGRQVGLRFSVSSKIVRRKRIVHPRAADEHEDAVSDEEDADDPTVVDDEEMEFVSRRPDAKGIRMAEDGVGERDRGGQDEGVVDGHLLLSRVQVIPETTIVPGRMQHPQQL